MSKILVCVTEQGDGEIVFKYGNHLAKELGGKPEGLLMQSYEYEGADVSESDRDALEALYREALKYKANLQVIHTNNVVRSLAAYTQKYDIDHVVLASHHRSVMIRELEEHTEGRVKVHFVPEQEENEE